MELRQPVDRLVEEVGARVLEAVPARVVGRVAEAEVGALVDDRGAGRDEVRDEGRRGAVGECQEDRVEGVARPAGSSAWTSSPVVARCGWIAVDRIVVAAAADEADQLDVRVARQQPDQLGTDIAVAPMIPTRDAAAAGHPRRQRVDATVAGRRRRCSTVACHASGRRVIGPRRRGHRCDMH